MTDSAQTNDFPTRAVIDPESLDLALDDEALDLVAGGETSLGLTSCCNT